MMYAVTGKILWVDLTTGRWREEDVPEQVYRDFLAGLGLAAYYLYQRMPAGADPLGPDNVLAFVSGLLTGTGSLLTGRWMAAAKSPLTGTWGDANCGGTLAPAIKQCGYDGIFFTGISPRPVYLYVGHGRVELRDAADLWGKDTRETEDVLHAAHTGKTLSVACIGPAGERLLADLRHRQRWGAAGRAFGAGRGDGRQAAQGGGAPGDVRHPRGAARRDEAPDRTLFAGGDPPAALPEWRRHAPARHGVADHAVADAPGWLPL